MPTNDEIRTEMNVKNMYHSVPSCTAILPYPKSEIVCGITNCQGIFANLGRFIEHMMGGKHSPCDPCKKITNKCLGGYCAEYYMCACNKGFKTKTECEQHIQDYHALELFWPLQIGAYACPKCLLIFEKEHLCQLHMELENHYSFTFRFKGEVLSSDVSKADLKEIKPIGIPVDLCNAYLKKCSKVPWRLECYNCKVALHRSSDIQYHPIGGNHRLTSCAQKLPAEVFGDFMCSHTCQYCLKVFNIPTGQKMEYHPCAEFVVGKVERNNCKTFQEFVLRKSLMIHGDICGLPKRCLKTDPPLTSIVTEETITNCVNVQEKNGNCSAKSSTQVTKKTSSNNLNCAKETGILGNHTCSISACSKASIDEFIRSVRNASGDCVKKSHDLRNNLIAKTRDGNLSRWQAKQWQSKISSREEQRSVGRCTREVFTDFEQEEQNRSLQSHYFFSRRKNRCRRSKRSRRIQKQRNRRRRKKTNAIITIETKSRISCNTVSDSIKKSEPKHWKMDNCNRVEPRSYWASQNIKESEPKHWKMDKSNRVEPRSYWASQNRVDHFSGGKWTVTKENNTRVTDPVHRVTSKVEWTPLTTSPVEKKDRQGNICDSEFFSTAKKSKVLKSNCHSKVKENITEGSKGFLSPLERNWDDLKNGLDYLMVDRTGNRTMNSNEEYTRKSNSQVCEDSFKIDFHWQMRDINANNSNRNNYNRNKKDGKTSTKNRSEEILKNGLKASKRRPLRYFNTEILAVTEKQFKEGSGSGMKQNYVNVVNIDSESDPEEEFANNSIIQMTRKNEDELKRKFEFDLEYGQSKFESYVNEEIDKKVESELYVKRKEKYVEANSSFLTKKDKKTKCKGSSHFHIKEKVETQLMNSSNFKMRKTDEDQPSNVKSPLEVITEKGLIDCNNSKKKEEAEAELFHGNGLLNSASCQSGSSVIIKEQQTNRIKNKASPAVREKVENQFKRKSDSPSEKQDVKRLKTSTSSCMVDKKKKNCPDGPGSKTGRGQHAKNSTSEENCEVQLTNNIEFWEKEVVAKRLCPVFRVPLARERRNKIQFINLTDSPQKSQTEIPVIDLTDTSSPVILIEDSPPKKEVESIAKQQETNNILVIEPLSAIDCRPSTSKDVPEVVSIQGQEERVLECSDCTYSLLNHTFGRCIGLTSARQIIFLDLDNWHSFFDKLAAPLPDKVFVWGFNGGGNNWNAPKNCYNFEVCKRNGCFDLNKRCGRRKDAADFAICMQVGRLDEKLPKHIPFIVLSGDKGFHELEVQMDNSERRIVVIDPHNESAEMVYRLITSVMDT